MEESRGCVFAKNRLTHLHQKGTIKISGTENAQGAPKGVAGSAPRLNQILTALVVFPERFFIFIVGITGNHTGFYIVKTAFR